MRIIVLSRWAWRPRRSPQALRKRSTSSPVRNSRGRSWALVRRGGGSVPFTMVGVAFLAIRLSFVLIGSAYHIVPFMGINGLSRLRWLGVMAPEARNPAEAGPLLSGGPLAAAGEPDGERGGAMMAAERGAMP